MPSGLQLGTDRIVLFDELLIEGQKCYLLKVSLVDAVAGSLIDPVSGGLKVAIVAGAGEGGSTGGLTDAQLRANPLAVTGSFFQATQPVSVSSIPLPSGAATDVGLVAIENAIASLWARLGNGSTHVVIDSMPASGGGLTDTELRATPLPVSGAFYQATQPVSVSALPLPSGAATEATLALIKAKTDNLDVALSTRAVTGLTDAQLRASSIPVQVKDSGRVRCVLKFQALAPAVLDTLLTLTKNLGGVESSATSHGVTAGKRLRITSIVFSIRSGAAAAAFATMNLRSLHNGATLLISPSLLRVDLGNTAAVIGAADKIAIPIPDGLEFSGIETLGVSLAAQAVTNGISIELVGYEYTP